MNMPTVFNKSDRGFFLPHWSNARLYIQLNEVNKSKIDLNKKKTKRCKKKHIDKTR